VVPVRAWTVEVEYEGLVPAPLLEDLLAEVGAFAAACNEDSIRTAFTLEVNAQDAVHAFDDVRQWAYRTAGIVAARGGPALRPVAVHIDAPSDLTMKSFSSKVPLVGYVEIAELGGFSRQYARQLAGKPDFPPRVGTVSGAPVYVLSEVETYLQAIGKLVNPREDFGWVFGPESADKPVNKASGTRSS
jgi:hypothetical protein